MAREVIGTMACPECGGGAEVKRTKAGLAYRWCMDCHAQYFPRTAEASDRLIAKCGGAKPAPVTAPVPAPAPAPAPAEAKAPAPAEAKAPAPAKPKPAKKTAPATAPAPEPEPAPARRPAGVFDFLMKG